MSSLQVGTAAGWSASAHRPDHDGLSEKEHTNFIKPHMWPPNSRDINPVDYAIWGALQQYESTTNDNSRRWKNRNERYSPSGKNSHSVSLITVSMNGVDVLKLLSRMAADTSACNLAWEVAHHFNAIERSLVNKTKHVTLILAVVFVLLGKVVTQ